MIKSILVLVCIVLLSGCSVKPESLNKDPELKVKLSNDLMRLGAKIDPKEARKLAEESLSYSRTLAQNYKLVAPASFHNMLINTGYRNRGLCYEWTEDMMEHLKKQGFKSFDLRWGVAFKGQPDEHNSVVVVAKGDSFEKGLLIDPWRHSGELYWGSPGKDLEFKWLENKQRSYYLGTIRPTLSSLKSHE